MRTLKVSLMLALALAAANSNASSVDVIWQDSGTGTTTVALGTAGIVGDIVLSVGVDDSAITGVGLLADSTGTVLMMGSTQITPDGWFDLAHNSATTNPHSISVISMGDLFLSNEPFAPGTSVIIGTITVNAGVGGGSVVVADTDEGNGFYGLGNVWITGEFSFGGGIVNVPEPITASLFGFGLLGLTIAGRTRGN